MYVRVTTPDSPPFIGERAWKIHPTVGGGPPEVMLTSLNGVKWEGPILSAGNCTVRDHPSPAKECGCGIHLCKMGYEHESWAPGTVKAIGPARCWGKVFENEYGFRAEYVEILGPTKIELRCRAKECEEEVTKIVASPSAMMLCVPSGSRHTLIAHCDDHPIVIGNTNITPGHWGYRDVEAVRATWERNTVDVDEWLDTTILALESRYKVPFWSWYDIGARIEQWK